LGIQIETFHFIFVSGFKPLIENYSMKKDLLAIIRCPVHRTTLRIEILEKKEKRYNQINEEIIWTGILYSESDFFYPIINGIPRLIVEAFEDYASFFKVHLPDYEQRKNEILGKYQGLVHQIISKNASTKKSFSQEWNLYSYDGDKTWDLDASQLLNRFLLETDESLASLQNKLVLDAGCGNGHLNGLLAQAGVRNVGMDFSQSVERAFEINENSNAMFVQADVEYPPFDFYGFDVVHSSGVLIATQRTELSLSCLDPCVKPGGKISIWSYQPRADVIHNLFNFIRNYSSKLPIRFQYYLYLFTLLPVSYGIKRMKGNKQNWREMMIDILDWFSPGNRWEHEISEVSAWFRKRNYTRIKTTDNNMWGFNLVGVKGDK